MDESKNNAKRLRIEIANLIISCLTPIIVIIVGTILANLKKNEEINQKYVELSISILKEKPKENETIVMRKWALDILNKYSPLKLSDSAKNELLFKPLQAGHWNGSFIEYNTTPVIWAEDGMTIIDTLKCDKAKK